MDTSGIEHAVRVEASTMYEAAGLAIAAFRAAKLHECEPGVMTELEIQVIKVDPVVKTIFGLLFANG